MYAVIFKISEIIISLKKSGNVCVFPDIFREHTLSKIITKYIFTLKHKLNHHNLCSAMQLYILCENSETHYTPSNIGPQWDSMYLFR